MKGQRGEATRTLKVILFLKHCQTWMEELLEHLWPLWEILVLKGEGGSAVVMKGRYLLIWGFLDFCFHTASLLLCYQILLHEIKLKYVSELPGEWFDLSVDLSNQQSFLTARLSACDITCDESLNCQLWWMAEPLSADRLFLSGRHLQPPEWRRQLLPLSAAGCGPSRRKHQSN